AEIQRRLALRRHDLRFRGRAYLEGFRRPRPGHEFQGAGRLARQPRRCGPAGAGPAEVEQVRKDSGVACNRIRICAPYNSCRRTVGRGLFPQWRMLTTTPTRTAMPVTVTCRKASALPSPSA